MIPARVSRGAALAVLRFACPEELREPVLGDVEERCGNLWREVAFGAVPLFLRRAEGAVKKLAPADSLALLAAALVVFSWEMVARQSSWPLAQLVMELSPGTATVTCMGCFVLLYGAFGAVAGGAITFAHRAGRLTGWGRGLATTAILLPPFICMAMPTPVDGIGFRLCQLAAILAGLFLARIAVGRILVRA
ncbi:hypothetical protein HK107_01435 [Parvularcula sp. ZS-1/3]|uniref:Uncharacterized protein n=1 Tax=Parvularcula mediterranea TaxID=2732508 RepID=A0A7Y3RJU5_9PROT|nr:hypothetical protein [Parvularcula mediterranea]NNU14985.1 hypothetical protein [Parvularcula mediterranea]